MSAVLVAVARGILKRKCGLRRYYFVVVVVVVVVVGVVVVFLLLILLITDPVYSLEADFSFSICFSKFLVTEVKLSALYSIISLTSSD